MTAEIESGSGLQVLPFSFSCGDLLHIQGHALLMDRSAMVVLGGAGTPLSLGNLSTSIPSRFGPQPLAAALLTGPSEAADELGQVLAARLAKKFDIQAFVSCEIGGQGQGSESEGESQAELLAQILLQLYQLLDPIYGRKP